jgi:hypothetical protein
MTRCGYHTLGLAHALAPGAFGSETPRPPVTSFLSPEITVVPKLTHLSNATYRGIDRLLDQTPLALHLPVVGPKKNTGTALAKARIRSHSVRSRGSLHDQRSPQSKPMIVVVVEEYGTQYTMSSTLSVIPCTSLRRCSAQCSKHEGPIYLP